MFTASPVKYSLLSVNTAKDYVVSSALAKGTSSISKHSATLTNLIDVFIDIDTPC